MRYFVGIFSNYLYNYLAISILHLTNYFLEKHSEKHSDASGFGVKKTKKYTKIRQKTIMAAYSS